MAARTPLYDRHLAAGARMTEFAGYDMPLQYSGIRDEHLAVRSRAGLFDVSHMGEVLVSGDGAAEWLQRLVTNDVSRLQPDQALYTVMLNERGGIIDDLIVMRGSLENDFLVVVNASTRGKDVAWMQEHAAGGVNLRDVSDGVALLALQGPRAVDVLEPLARLDGGRPLSQLKPFTASGVSIGGIDDASVQRVSRTGYTGEDGFEIYISAERAGQLWDLLLDAGAPAGVVPAGLGARDTLRLEAGLRLYGQDMDEDTDPFSCALGWTVKMQKGDFIGRDALAGLDPQRPPRSFVGLRLPERSIARHGHSVQCDGETVGEVTSGGFGFTLGYAIATASVAGDLGKDSPLSVDVRGTAVAAERTPLPFYRRPKGTG